MANTAGLQVTFLEGASGLLACRAVLQHMQGDMDAQHKSVQVGVLPAAIQNDA
jgi:hypothetical protein